MLSGKPATRAAARNSVAPPPGGKTDPTARSSIKSGEMPERESRDLSVWARRSAAGTSLRPPRPPLVKGVRRHVVTTMSSGDLVRGERAEAGDEEGAVAERWDWIWERRWFARERSVARRTRLEGKGGDYA